MVEVQDIEIDLWVRRGIDKEGVEGLILVYGTEVIAQGTDNASGCFPVQG